MKKDETLQQSKRKKDYKDGENMVLSAHSHAERFDDDALWKDLIERFFYQMLRRAVPSLFRDADTSKPVQFLDKELRQVVKRVGERAKVADYLVDVPLKDGTDAWILLHLEVQGKSGGDFALRMYHYRSLIFVMHKRPMAALAIITDERPKNENVYYTENLYNTSIDYRFNRLVLKELDDDELITSDNPFDLALFAAKKSLTHKNDENRRYLYQKELIKLLKNRSWSHDDIYDLFLFIDQFVALKDEKLIADIRKDGDELWEGEDYMPITTAERAERTYTHRGYRMGIEKGIEKGERQKALETARKMMSRGMDIAVIADLTGLSEEDVRSLKS